MILNIWYGRPFEGNEKEPCLHCTIKSVQEDGTVTFWVENGHWSGLLTKDRSRLIVEPGTRYESEVEVNYCQFPDGDPVTVPEEQPERFDIPLPKWAISAVPDSYEPEYCFIPGAQLCTRDGRKVGNAVIVSCGTSNYTDDPRVAEITFYEVLTDMGTEMTLTLAELMEFYYKPRYIMDITEAVNIRKFG